MRVLSPSTHSAHTSPPRPPSPPSGPPNSMNFSRRKEMAPPPPLPERIKILAWSRNFIIRILYGTGAIFAKADPLSRLKCCRPRHRAEATQTKEKCSRTHSGALCVLEHQVNPKSADPLLGPGL